MLTKEYKEELMNLGLFELMAKWRKLCAEIEGCTMAECEASTTEYLKRFIVREIEFLDECLDK